MLTVVIELTSKVAANYANNDQDKTIDYKDMPTNIWEQYDLKNYPVNIITMNNMKLYHNDLTKDKHGAIQKLHTVEYTALGTGNTTRYDGQIYFIMNDGTLYGHLDYQLTKTKTAFITGAPGLQGMI